MSSISNKLSLSWRGMARYWWYWLSSKQLHAQECKDDDEEEELSLAGWPGLGVAGRRLTPSSAVVVWSRWPWMEGVHNDSLLKRRLKTNLFCSKAAQQSRIKLRRDQRVIKASEELRWQDCEWRIAGLQFRIQCFPTKIKKQFVNFARLKRFALKTQTLWRSVCGDKSTHSINSLLRQTYFRGTSSRFSNLAEMSIDDGQSNIVCDVSRVISPPSPWRPRWY